jgi:predicted transcriptional regulator
MKTLAIRLEDELHAQLSVIAQLSELTVTDAIRQAIEQWIEQKRTAPELTNRAQSILDEIERDAAQRRSAIATLFGETSEPEPKPTPETEPPRSRPSQRGKGGEPAGS